MLPFDLTGLRYITIDGTNLPANLTILDVARRKLTTLYILFCVGVAGVCRRQRQIPNRCVYTSTTLYCAGAHITLLTYVVSIQKYIINRKTMSLGRSLKSKVNQSFSKKNRLPDLAKNEPIF